MIEQYLLTYLNERLANKYKDFLWSISYDTSNDDSLVIYPGTGDAPVTYDDRMRFPTYQIYIKSSDFDKAKLLAHDVFDLIQCLNHQKVQVQLNDEIMQYYVYFIEATSDIIEVGVNEDEVLELSLNFRATLQKYSNDYQL